MFFTVAKKSTNNQNCIFLGLQKVYIMKKIDCKYQINKLIVKMGSIAVSH